MVAISARVCAHFQFPVCPFLGAGINSQPLFFSCERIEIVCSLQSEGNSQENQ